DKAALIARLEQHDHTKGMPLVAIQAANGETGVIQPIKTLAEIVHSHKGLLIVDAVQYLGKVDMNLSALDADFSIISAHKIGGPKNIGALICHSDIITPQPLIKGTQESGLRGGTQSIALCASFAAALKKREDMMINTDYINRIQNLRNFFEEGLEKLSSNIKLHGKMAKRLCNTSFFSFTNIEAQTVQIALDLAGFAVSRGSACSSGRIKHSEILAAMGVENSMGAIRISIGPETTKEDLLALLLSIKSFI
ncbi:MAG: aminotransferase class V-fold PLP-dependent enzyme, partial [Alphaproteobacteria bacterium]|nr:aminotransferase class V-fold PLP-dependent enzyme [Alphaproteobacteria bacterium]